MEIEIRLSKEELNLIVYSLNRELYSQQELLNGFFHPNNIKNEKEFYKHQKNQYEEVNEIRYLIKKLDKNKK